MPTIDAIRIGLTVMADLGMLRAARDPATQADTWARFIRADIPDRLLGDAIKSLASGEVETYGSVKPADVNRAAVAIRRRRVKTWLGRHQIPTDGRCGFEQAAYSRGFLRALGDGCDAVEADRYGRAAAAQASAVATSEPGTPLPELLARMDAALSEGRVPWAASLPPSRPSLVLEAPAPQGVPAEPARGRLRALVAGLAERSAA